ncbi:MAG: hypothetical protein ACOZNI_23605 [Myxococcota bacterium]
MIPFNHDLFGGAEAPLFRLTEASPVAAPVAWDPAASPDALLLKSADAPDKPQSVEIPVGRSGRVLHVLTACQGPLDVKDIVATGEVRFAGGATQPLKWMVGEQAWPAWAGVSGRGADAVPVGVNPSGDVLTASLLTVPLAWDAPVTSVFVESRPGALSFAVLGLAVGEPATVQATPAAPTDTYPFAISAWPGSPAPGRIARIAARDGHLVREDGTRARFWGVNLVGPAALPAPELAEARARVLADAGFDIVRPHHLDMAGEVSLVNPRRGEPGEPVARADMLDRLDRFHAALRAAGISTFLETWTARSFRPEEGLPAPQGLVVGHKYASHFWPEYTEAKKAWVRAVWGRTNPYTGLRYADDDAVAVVEISNEDSLLVAWSGGALEKLPGAHRRRLDELWNGWLRRKYGKDEKVAAAWSRGTRAGLQPGEALALDSIAREPAARNRTDLWPTQRAADLVAFYGELESAHQAEMARFLREEMGFRAPLVCNTSFGVPVADALLAACDVVDLHVYFDPAGEQTAFGDASIVADPLHQRILEKLAWCQEGKPCTISELNQTWPGRFAHEAPLVWAALAGRQDLAGVIWFAWSHGEWEAAPVGTLDLAGRPDFLAQLPAAGALFRSMAAPARRFVRWWSEDGLLRDLAEQPGLFLLPQVSWGSYLDQVVRTAFGRRPTPSTLAPVAASPIAWDPDVHAFAVDGEVQAIVGRAGATSRLRVLALDVVAASLAGDLLTVVGRSERAGTLRADGGPGLLAWGRGEIGLQRLRGTVHVRTGGRPEAWALDGRGEPARRVKVTRKGDGWWAIGLDGLDTPWVELR